MIKVYEFKSVFMLHKTPVTTTALLILSNYINHILQQLNKLMWLRMSGFMKNGEITNMDLFESLTNVSNGINHMNDRVIKMLTTLKLLKTVYIRSLQFFNNWLKIILQSKNCQLIKAQVCLKKWTQYLCLLLKRAL